MEQLSLRGKIMGMMPWYIRKKLQYYFRYNVPAQEASNARRVNKIRNQGYANVMFIASTLPMWRYDEVMNLMMRDDRFNVTLVLCSINEYAAPERKRCIDDLKSYFDSRRIEYVNADDPLVDLKALFDEKDFDIIFYPQPYDGIYGNELEFQRNRERLFCHCPYGMDLINDLRFTDSEFHNYAWRIFQSCPTLKKVCRKNMKNDARNVVVTGESHYDLIRSLKKLVSPWKQQDRPKKKVIWAPHFSIVKGLTLFRDGFVRYHKLMLEIVNDYKEDIQFVLKPHPRLKTQLYSMPEWGKELTDAYFDIWDNQYNSQVYTGGYESLFANSDAMIHDSNSFIGEYLFTGNPVIYTTNEVDKMRTSMNLLGKKCLDAHYIATSESDIRDFLNKVVLKGEDPKRQERQALVKREFTMNDGLTVGRRMYESICDGLEFQY